MKNGILASLLALIGALLYAPTAGYDFVFDDKDYVVDNAILDEGLGVEAIRRSLLEAHAANWHPLTWWTHLFDRAWFGLDPAGHHIVNVVWFAATAALLFCALVALSGRSWPSFFVTLFFCVHPLRVESVAWVSERKDVVSGFFFAACLLAYARYARSRRRSDYLALFVALALGLMSKPMLVTLPLVLLLLDAWPLGRCSGARTGAGSGSDGALPSRTPTLPGDARKTPRPDTGFQLLAEKLPLLALAALASWMTVWAQSQFAAVSSLEVISLPLRLLNALDAYGFYLSKTVWPSDLTCFYQHPLLTETDPIRAIWARAATWGGVLVVITSVALWKRRSLPFLAVGWFWFLGMLVPVIGIVSVGAQAYADRYAYLPTLGLYIGVVFGVDALVRARPTLRIPLTSIGIAVSAALAFATTAQLPTWKNGEALFTRALEIRERNHVAHYSLGQLLIEEGRHDEAVEHLERAASIAPGFLYPQLSLARLMRDTGRPERALPHIQQAIRIDPELSPAHIEHALILRDIGDTTGALAAIDRSLGLNSEDSEAHFNRAILLARLSRLDEAREAYVMVLARAPDFTSALVNLGNLDLRLGRTDDAIESLERAAALAPELAPAHAGLGLAYQSLGATRDAIRHLREAVRIEPTLIEISQRLAWLLATTADEALRDPTEALRLSQRCVEAAGTEHSLLLETLAAALAANSDFEQAIEVQKRALGLIPEERSQKGRRRLAQYESRQPLRER